VEESRPPLALDLNPLMTSSLQLSASLNFDELWQQEQVDSVNTHFSPALQTNASGVMMGQRQSTSVPPRQDCNAANISAQTWRTFTTLPDLDLNVFAPAVS
jgi:hypothetical protein